MKTKNLLLTLIVFSSVAATSCSKSGGPVREAVSHKQDYRDAYIYGFPMVMNYGVLYEYFVDRNSRPVQGALQPDLQRSACVHAEGHGDRHAE